MDLSAIQNATTAVTSIANQALGLINPNDVQGITAQFNPINIAVTADTRSFKNSRTFIFHYEGENTTTLQTDITDHFVEDNTALQDHIALKPLVITTHGYIGELNNVVPPLLQPLKLAVDALLPLQAYTPSVTQTALIAYNQAIQAGEIAQQIANTTLATISTLKNEKILNKQQQAYTLFFQYFNQRQLFTVNTPWGQFKDMAIQTLRSVQDEETRMISSFEITFKQMRFAKSLTVYLVRNGRNQNQSAPVVNVGTSSLGTHQIFNPAAVE